MRGVLRFAAALLVPVVVAGSVGPAQAEAPVEARRGGLGFLEGVVPEALLPPVLHEIAVPLMRQVGDKANCGPTAAAMVLGAYQQLRDATQLEALRDQLGEWSWEAFPARRLSLPGYDPGLSTTAMLLAMLNHFASGEVAFDELPEHPWLPRTAWNLLALKATVGEGRPVVTMVQASTLWGTREPGLHWVVVRAVGDGKVVYNDPADSTRVEVPIDKFWEAWRLLPIFRELSLTRSFTAIVGSRPVPARPGAQVATDL